MKRDLKGFAKIFSFTFFQQVHAKAYITLTVLLACLCLALPAIGMTMAEYFDDSWEETEEGGSGQEEGTGISPVKEVFVVDKAEGEAIDFSFLSLAGTGAFQNVTYTDCGGDINQAAELVEEKEDALVLVIEKGSMGYQMKILLPDESPLTWEDAEAFEAFMNQYFRAALVEKSGLDYSSLAVLNTPVYIEEEVIGTDSSISDSDQVTETEEDFEETEGMDMLLMVLRYILPFANIMVLYFMILFYGQGIAGNVILEKSSKLMDTFLVSVKPWTMIFGKVFAIVSASSLQLLLWMVSLVGGFSLGTFLVKMINPDTDMLLVTIFESLKGFGSLFSLPGTVLGILIILAGFMLYSTLASICGALVEKQEDLSSSIALFTMVLVVSFFCTLYGGMMNEAGIPAWMHWVPFTATLITPSGLMLGDVSIAAGLGSLAVILVCIFLLLIVAGKIYQMMVLYRGKAPSVAKLIQMFKNQ